MSVQEQVGALVFAGGALGGTAGGFLGAFLGGPAAAIAGAVAGFGLGAIVSGSFADAFVLAPRWSEEIERGALSAGLKRKRRGFRLSGRVGDVSVSVEPRATGATLVFTHVVRPLAIVKTPGMFMPRPSGEDVVIGDPELDARLHFAGSEIVLRSLLDAETRAALLDAVAKHPDFRVAEGALSWTPPAGTSAETIAKAIVELAAVTRRLRNAARERLGAIVREDPLPAIRLAALRTLLDDPGSSPELAERVARQACADAAPEVRLLGASHVGDVATLEALAIDDSLAAELRTRAVSALASGAHGPAIRSLVPRLLSCAEPALRAKAAGLVRELAMREALERLRALEPAPVERAEREAFAAALRALPDPLNEPALVRLLDPADEGAREAIRALAETGTVAAVEPLRRIADAWSVPADVRSEASSAIAAIRSRLEHADAGQLSIAGAQDAGRLSVPSQQGQLSIGDKRRD